MKSRLAAVLTVLVLPVALVGCQLGGLTPQASPNSTSDPGLMTCAAWLQVEDRERVALANQLIGDSGDLLERIRVRQHQAPGTPRDVLVRDLVGSLTKNCDVWPPRGRPIGEVMDALY
jgi:hypothetical protein